MTDIRFCSSSIPLDSAENFKFQALFLVYSVYGNIKRLEFEFQISHMIDRFELNMQGTNYCRFHITFQSAVPKFVVNLPITFPNLEVGRELRNEVRNFGAKFTSLASYSITRMSWTNQVFTFSNLKY